MVSVSRLLLLIFLGATFMLVQPDKATGHWDMEARFWAAEGNEKFFLRIHNGEHANRRPVKKDMNVCFWIEDTGEGSNRLVSEKICSTVMIKPDEWMTFEFGMKDAVFEKDTVVDGKMKKGRYRAVALAREQKGWFMKLLFGAAMERLYSYFEVK